MWRIKWGSWEYWPMWLVYASVSVYYVWLAIRSRSLLFFSASNPSIDFGGMCFEKKSKIYDILPKEYCPKTILIFPEETIHQLQEKMKLHGIAFPCVAKPEIGGKGWGVKKINSIEDLTHYQSVCSVEFLLQEWIVGEEEYSVFYCRYPSEEFGFITSVTQKMLLKVTGNGMSTVEELVRQSERAFLQLDTLRKQKQVHWDAVPNAGEEILLVPYGNHARGALFLNKTNDIDDTLTRSIDKIAKSIEGFYFGRFDLLTNSWDELRNGENISIVELNGCGAEPVHIYEPGFSFMEGQKVIWKHFSIMRKIAEENKRSGHEYMKPLHFINGWREDREYRKKAPARLLIQDRV